MGETEAELNTPRWICMCCGGCCADSDERDFGEIVSPDESVEDPTGDYSPMERRWPGHGSAGSPQRTLSGGTKMLAADERQVSQKPLRWVRHELQSITERTEPPASE